MRRTRNELCVCMKPGPRFCAPRPGTPHPLHCWHPPSDLWCFERSCFEGFPHPRNFESSCTCWGRSVVSGARNGFEGHLMQKKCREYRSEWLRRPSRWCASGAAPPPPAHVFSLLSYFCLLVFWWWSLFNRFIEHVKDWVLRRNFCSGKKSSDESKMLATLNQMRK